MSRKNRNGRKGLKARRANLLREDPFCWYCGIELVFYETNGETLPHNFATIEHLFSRAVLQRISPSSRRVHTEGTRVLACHRCNQDRGNWDVLLTIAEERGEMWNSRKMKEYESWAACG